ncbi:10182_t:CDS:1 [Scutellospora calospora]|uniref:10182_t:CDS:1 n=1 Tax=Scutellospora calospora TaxID=85575 RepID=A0ACA9M3Q3_9GLOM|nr:10182_t:CDS:1 [Scutellospora calospora]
MSKLYIQNVLPTEILTGITKRIRYPKNLILCCRRLAIIFKDPQVKAEWIIYQFGAANCLFYAIQLGPSFLDVAVAQAIIAKGGIISRYSIQRIHLNFGCYDQKLIELKAAHGMASVQSSKIIPWASNLHISVYMFLLKAASDIYNHDLCLKGDDMKLFHFLLGRPYTTHYSPLVMAKNMDQIKDLILHFKFIPLPSRKEKNSIEEYPSKYGHKNKRQLNVIARVVLICKDIVPLWKEIGYYEICHDVNDLVMQGALLIIFPPTPSSGWLKPDIKIINARLTELIELGFQLTYHVIIEIFLGFESRLEQIGIILIESFADIKHESRVNFLRKCLIETFNPKLKFKNQNILNFFYKYLPDSSDIEFNRAFEFYSNTWCKTNT